MKNILYEGDCLEIMKQIPDNSIDLVLTDPPYGTTACKWDSVINLDLMWEQLKRLIKPNGAIVLFAAQPFTSHLIMSNIKQFKYCWVWNKSQSTGHLNSWKMPMKKHEDICVFYSKQPLYNPILKDKPLKDQRPKTKRTKKTECYGNHDLSIHKCPVNKSMPNTILNFNNAQNTVHPTQKPVPLLEYLIKTYTNEGETVLDFTAGSGSTGEACLNTNRNFILIEKDPHYCNVIRERLGIE